MKHYDNESVKSKVAPRNGGRPTYLVQVSRFELSAIAIGSAPSSKMKRF